MSAPLTDSINALTMYINEITENNDSNLSDAVRSLADGYGGYSLDDIANGVEPSGDIIINSEKIISHCFFVNKNIRNVYSEQTKYVEGSAFQNCSSLKSVSFKGVLTIGSDAFRTGSLTKVDLPSATNIGWSVFEGDVSLSEVNIPSAVSLGSFAFKFCTSLRMMYLPSVKNIGSNCFEGCNSLTDIYLSDSESSYSGAPWGAPSTCTIHYNTIFNEDGKPILDEIAITWDSASNNKYIGENGVIGNSSNFHYSNLLSVDIGDYTYNFTTNDSNGRKTRIHGYDNSGQWVRQLTFADTSQGDYAMRFSITDDIKYVRISNTTFVISESLVKQ